MAGDRRVGIDAKLKPTRAELKVKAFLRPQAKLTSSEDSVNGGLGKYVNFIDIQSSFILRDDATR